MTWHKVGEPGMLDDALRAAFDCAGPATVAIRCDPQLI